MAAPAVKLPAAYIVQELIRFYNLPAHGPQFKRDLLALWSGSHDGKDNYRDPYAEAARQIEAEKIK